MAGVSIVFLDQSPYPYVARLSSCQNKSKRDSYSVVDRDICLDLCGFTNFGLFVKALVV